jgi:SAM-dependent methyltransferase
MQSPSVLSQAASSDADPHNVVMLDACRICGNRSVHRRYTAKEMMFGTREEFEYFLCGHCGCLQIKQIPHDVSRYYPPAYYSLSTSAPGVAYVPYPRRILERLRVAHALFGRGRLLAEQAAYLTDYPEDWRRFEPFLQRCALKRSDARFLDVGCGSRSWWLEGLGRLGFSNLIGVDPHIDRSVAYDGIRIQKGEVGEIADVFDVITLHHSLEHIPDQLGTLRALRALLKPTGVCIVRLPLVSSLVWEMYGTDWVELDAPRHFYLHSSDSMEKLADMAGFSIEHTMWDSTAFEFYGSEQYRRGIPLLAENSFSAHPDKSDFTYQEMARFAKLAERANKEGRGGRGCFFLRPS